jgi:uncharacterized protein (DUF4415 family)
MIMQFGTIQVNQSSTQQPSAHESHLSTVEHYHSSHSMRRASQTNIETSKLDVEDIDISLSSKFNISKQNNKAIRVKLKEDVLEKFKE